MLAKLKRKLVFNTAYEALIFLGEHDIEWSFEMFINVETLKNYLDSLDNKYFVDNDDDTGEIRIFEFY